MRNNFPGNPYPCPFCTSWGTRHDGARHGTVEVQAVARDASDVVHMTRKAAERYALYQGLLEAALKVLEEYISERRDDGDGWICFSCHEYSTAHWSDISHDEDCIILKIKEALK